LDCEVQNNSCKIQNNIKLSDIIQSLQ